MKITEFAIQGPKLIELKSFKDDRGFFVERFKKSIFDELNLPCDFIQDNFSRSTPKVLRGVHYQYSPPQGKLVTALSGRIYDVAVDIRKNSPTFGQHVAIELDGATPSWFWVPAGFAHGFCVMGDQCADVLYKVDNYYNAQGESGIIWNDLDLRIPWPLKNPLLSPKDAAMQTFADYKKTPIF